MRASILGLFVISGAVFTAVPVSAQSPCADLAGETFGIALVLETEEISESTAVNTAYGGGTVLSRPTCRVPRRRSDVLSRSRRPPLGTPAIARAPCARSGRATA